MKSLRANLGLTLIELLIVLGIFSLVGITTGVGFSSLMFQSYFTNTVERLVRTLHTAQAYSFSGRNDSSWGVHYEAGKVVLFKGTDYASRDPAFDAVTDIPSVVEITGWNDLYFDKIRGVPSATLSILVEVSGRAGTVSVNEQGGISRP
jgi:prepilin-type N-terminal cleavage/methylation domain-containing protein